ncbi:hypothetical protein BZG35_08455 [Brevundimonas sp. LM2]|uniref:ParB/RepB/Spo0J family partition protein n=1 Tax=Brevundimonas sp. LM2 TaxID=1938605 RepID=UPI000983FF0F|nr:ParB/RepB/Spo0J family partition protein [Brevundimonas sp. LM2]AQR61678.1 hypothetical protein BZG35_08455 [Brevundimonas sp. LM2]
MTLTVIETNDTGTTETGPDYAHGAVLYVPLDKLKPSDRNARKAGHAADFIETLAASIAVKGVLQPPVIEPELRDDGTPSGYFRVTIGEGRRQALRLLAKRKRIKKTHAVRCVLDLANDPHEISLDENITRAEMHPADQFAAFQRLATEKAYGAEEIAARFGVTPTVVRQRLRLAAVSPTLVQLYREGGMTLEQLTAFTVTDDHARQERVWADLGYNRSRDVIRRQLVQGTVDLTDRRVRFVGLDAYEAAGGVVVRDLFAQGPDSGFVADADLLDRLVRDRLQAVAREIEGQGWRWVTVTPEFDYRAVADCRRVWPEPVPPTEDEATTIAGLEAELEGLCLLAEGGEESVEARIAEIDAALRALQTREAFTPEDVALSGVFVSLGYDGDPRIERGFVRPEDEPEDDSVEETTDEKGDGEGTSPSTDDDPTIPDAVLPDEADEAGPPVSAALLAELSAYRTLSLRDAVASQPTVALTAVVHALALRTFYPHVDIALDIEVRRAPLHAALPGGGDETPAARRIANRHDLWSQRLPNRPDDLWAYVSAMDGTGLLDLLAHCVGLRVNALVLPHERLRGRAVHADQLAVATALDMAPDWSPTVATYFGRVRKGAMLEAVREAVSDDAAERLSGLKKPELAEAAAEAVAGTGWLPAALRPPLPPAPAPATEAHQGPALDPDDIHSPEAWAA